MLGDCPAGLEPLQWLEIGEKLLWKYDKTPHKGRYHDRNYTRIFFKGGGIFFNGRVSFGVGSRNFPPKIVGLIRSFSGKENLNGPAISNITQIDTRQSDKQANLCKYKVL